MSALTVESIRSRLSEHAEVLAEYQVGQFWVFGSVAAGTANPESDLDFLVEFKHKSFRNFMGLRCFLEDLFDRKIDLATPESLRPELHQTIARESVHAA